MQKRARKPLNASGHRFADLTLVTDVFRASKPLRDLAAKLVTSLTDSFSSKEFRHPSPLCRLFSIHHLLVPHKRYAVDSTRSRLITTRPMSQHFCLVLALVCLVHIVFTHCCDPGAKKSRERSLGWSEKFAQIGMGLRDH